MESTEHCAPKPVRLLPIMPTRSARETYYFSRERALWRSMASFPKAESARNSARRHDGRDTLFATSACLDLIAAMKSRPEALNQISRVVELQGFIYATADFEGHAKVPRRVFAPQRDLWCLRLLSKLRDNRAANARRADVMK